MRLHTLLPIVMLFGVPSCGKEVARVALTGFGDTKTGKIELAADTEVSLAVHIDEYSYSGQNYIAVTAELMNGDDVVHTLRCRGFEFEGGAGSGCGATSSNSSCTTKVPPGGADAVRITTALEQASGTAEVDGLAVSIRVPDE